MARFKTVIVDADSYPYALGFAYKGDPIAHALGNMKKKLKEIKEECDAEDIEVYVGGSTNYREDVAVTHGYKANRAETEKPAHHAAIKDYLINVHGAVISDGVETDDVVSALLYQDYIKAGGDRDVTTLVLSSIDKDLNNTPGWHHRPRTGEVVWISDLQATRHFWYQMLMGDRIDNIKGIPELPWAIRKKYNLGKSKGLGKAGAAKLMATTSGIEDAEQMVYEMYLHYGQMEGLPEEVIKDYILENAQLLWMVREFDEDNNPIMFQINEVIYGQAKERQEYYSTVQEEGGRDIGTYGEARGDDPYRSGEGSDDGYDGYSGPLRVSPT